MEGQHTSHTMDMNHGSRQPTLTPGAGGGSEDLPTKTSSRKSHRKTRTGCRTCKTRKIKCDETRPECKNCQKHSVSCDFLAHQTQLPGRPSGNGYLNHASPSSMGTPHQNDTHLPSFNRFTSDALNGQPAPLNLQDLELLHNFSTHTASTLHSDPIIKTLIRTSVPQLGLQYEFVMRGVLAISALHLAHFKPDKRDYYVAQALHHQEIGLRSASALMPHITEENSSAIYIFSVLTFYISLAKPRGEGDIFLVGEHGAADWLFLIKGTSYIMASSRTSLLSGPFGPLFKAGQRRHEIRKAQAEPIPGYDPVLELETLIHNSVYDQGHLEYYNSALDGLRGAFVMAYSTPSYETGDVFSWLFQVSDGFLELVRQHLPEALAILGYFCILLKRLDHYWWVEGWGNDLMSKVYHILDDEHRLWIRWPMEEMGWMPK